MHASLEILLACMKSKPIRVNVAQTSESTPRMENTALRCNSKRADLLKPDASNAYMLDAQNGSY